jgi:hypothetical protein
MARVLAFNVDGAWQVHTLDADGLTRSVKAGENQSVTIDGSTDPPTFTIDDPWEAGPPVIHAFRFAWDATRGVRK